MNTDRQSSPVLITDMLEISGHHFSGQGHEAEALWWSVEPSVSAHTCSREASSHDTKACIFCKCGRCLSGFHMTPRAFVSHLLYIWPCTNEALHPLILFLLTKLLESFLRPICSDSESEHIIHFSLSLSPREGSLGDTSSGVLFFSI